MLAKQDRYGSTEVVLNAVSWAYTYYWGEKGIGAILFFLLAGLLGPKDFGTVFIAGVYIGFLQMFLNQGLVAAVIQRKNLEQAHLDAVFWMDLALSLLLVSTSILFGPYWAALNHAPEVASVIYVLSLSIVIEALAIVQISVLQRQMNYRTLSIRTNVSMLVSGAVGIAMVLLGFGVWSLVSQQLVRDMIAVALLWRMSSWRPSFSFSRRSLNELLDFSVPNFVAHLASFFDAQVASTVLGLFFGPVAVGLYKFAEKTVITVVTMSIGSIHTVSLPHFSRAQDNATELRRNVLNVLRMSAIMTLPALAGVAVVSGPLMATIGDKWAPASDALAVLCVAGMAMIFANFTGPLIQALGRPRLSVILEWGRVIVGIAALVLAGFLVRNSDTREQVFSIALARLFTAVFLIGPVFVYVLLKLSKISLRDFLVCVLPAVLASVVVVLSVEIVSHLKAIEECRSLITLVVEIVVGAIGGLTTLIFIDPKVRRMTGLIYHEAIRRVSTKAL